MDDFNIAAPQSEDRVRVPIERGLTLAQHLYLAGAFQAKSLCSGAGRCGLCQARFLSLAPAPLPEELERIGPHRLEEGWRLTCRRMPVPDSLVEVALASQDKVLAPLPAPCPDAFLGIDLGTTSIHWRFTLGGQVLGGSFPNPQLGAGSEVMSRLALARSPKGAARLRQAVASVVRGVVAGLPCLPETVCLAGNTCMTYLALGMDVSGLAAAPYHLDWPGNEFASLDAHLPEVYIPPLVAPFVGADVTAGLAALEFSIDKPRPPFLLADLGTNGEFALVLPEGRVLVASVPMGPALEGVGMAQGMLAGPHAAVSFTLSPGGLAPVPYGGKSGRLRGVSGTGYVSLLAKLRFLGVLSETGQFVREPSSPLAARVLTGLGESGGEPRLDAGGVELYASDVEALLKVKAAFETAVRILLAEAQLSYSGLSAVLLAGALGEHVQATDLEVLGFFPPGSVSRVRCVGNTSLTGACLAAARDDVRRWLADLPGRTRLVEVLAVPDFQRMYLDSMRLTHAG